MQIFYVAIYYWHKTSYSISCKTALKTKFTKFLILLANLDFLSLLIFLGLATYRFQVTQGTDNPFICTNITKG